jgi:hypothetical protein
MNRCRKPLGPDQFIQAGFRQACESLDLWQAQEDHVIWASCNILTVIRILKAAGGWNHGLHLRIENLPFTALVIEATDESGPRGLPAISVCHYGEQNDDAMRDPEVLFELGIAGFSGNVQIFDFSPFYWRNDYVGEHLNGSDNCTPRPKLPANGADTGQRVRSTTSQPTQAQGGHHAR